MFEAEVKQLELSVFELQFAFEGLAHENVWKRAAPHLLSIGELAGHCAYWQAVRLAGDGDDPGQCRIKSPLVDRRFRYYPADAAEPLSPQLLAMTAADVHTELLRVHGEAMAALRQRAPYPEDPIPGCPAGFTYGAYLAYAGFHLAYHIGQMYTVRHLLGDATPDN
jgi:hypothetical protein